MKRQLIEWRRKVRYRIFVEKFQLSLFFELEMDTFVWYNKHVE